MKRNMTAKTARKPKARISKTEAESWLWSAFEELVIDGDLFSFTDHAGINVRTTPPDNVWDRFRVHYDRGEAGIDFERYVTDFATWGPIASRVVEIQLEKARDAASA
jgi:hypothetical protein